MSAKSQTQQAYQAMVHAAKKGELKGKLPIGLAGKVKKTAHSMAQKAAKELEPQKKMKEGLLRKRGFKAHHKDPARKIYNKTVKLKESFSLFCERMENKNAMRYLSKANACMGAWKQKMQSLAESDDERDHGIIAAFEHACAQTQRLVEAKSGKDQFIMMLRNWVEKAKSMARSSSRHDKGVREALMFAADQLKVQLER